MSAGGWLAAARAAADRPPVSPRELLLCGAAIGSVDPDVAARMVAAGLPLRSGGGGWHLEGDADTALDRLARWLRAAGLVGRWRDEQLAVEDAAGRRVGAVERAAARALGIATRAVHLVGTTAEGRVWVQQRALDKATDPGLWDTLMGGQIGDGESAVDALRRETWEEAGLDIEGLEALAEGQPLTLRCPVDDGYRVERIDVYDARVPSRLEPTNRDGEVMAFACLAPAELRSRLAAGAFTLEATLILGRLLEHGSTVAA